MRRIIVAAVALMSVAGAYFMGHADGARQGVESFRDCYEYAEYVGISDPYSACSAEIDTP